MWVKKTDYLALVERAARAETRADWLSIRVNQLELERGTEKAQSGQPAVIPQITKTAAASKPYESPNDIDFDDMGDELAHQLGVSWDDAGRVVQH